MTFSDLQSKLRPLSAPGTNPPLVLDAALIGSDAITALLDSTLGTSALSIQEPQVSVDGSQIVVEGKASFLNIDRMRVKAVFEDDNQKIKFRLTANLPDTWTFGQSFPDLPQNFDSNPQNYGYAESYLELLAFSKPVFVLTTHPHKDPESAVQFEKGLNFRGQIVPSGLLQGLELLTGKDGVLVTGLIASDDETPEFCLSAQVPLRLGDNPVAKKLQNVRLKLWNSLSSADTAAARIELSVQLEIVAGKTVELYCPFRIGAPLDFLVIGGRFTNVDLPNLGDIAELVGGKDLQDKLPSELRTFGGLTIREVRTGVSLTGPDLAYVLVSVRTTSPWTIVERILKIDSIFVTWLIESPFKSDARRISCDLEGRLYIADVGLDLYAQFPDFRMTAALAEGSTIKLGALLKHFIPDIPLPDDSLVISTLALLIDPTLKTYQVDARVENVWSIPLGSAKLAIASLSLSLTKTEERVTGLLAGAMELRLPVDGAENKVTLTLSAALPDSPTGGWQFTGSTGPGQNIPIGKLIEWIGKNFGAVDFPGSVVSFAIRNLIVSFNTATKDFVFGCEGGYSDGGTEVAASLKIKVLHKNGSVQTSCEGTLGIVGLQFGANFLSSTAGEGKSTNAFIGTFEDSVGHPVRVDEFLKKTADFDPQTGVTFQLKKAIFAYLKEDQGEPLLLGGLNLDIDIDLAKRIREIEFLKSAAAGQSFGLKDLQIFYASNALTQASVKSLDAAGRPVGKFLPEASAQTAPSAGAGGQGAPTAPVLKKGLNFSAKLSLGSGTPYTLELPAGQPAAAAAEGEPLARTAEKTEFPTKWFDLQKSLGPLYLGRVGFQFRSEKKTVNLLLDSSVELLGLRVGLLGLRVGAPIATLAKFAKPDPSLLPTLYNQVEFGLEGLELNFERGPVQISGGLLRAGENKYVGSLLIKTDVFSIFGFGAYETLNEQPSLFLFAILDKDLGGPPCFHVTGLAVGFGYNRKLLLPPIEKVESYALVEAALKPSEYRDLSKALVKITNVDVAKSGEYWFAVGVRFTSFELIEAFALLTVSFGTETAISILGLARITVPPKAPTEIPKLACAELALKVSFRVESGVLTAEALLTSNSYVFTKDCKLTGGFAFYAWFKDLEIPGKERGSKIRILAGDFVVTLGGYHPKFKPPEHYPLVPRLGLAWQVYANLRIAGEVYFALTPSCLMLGGRLAALFEEGGLRAWFDAYAHFFIAWQPLKYDADVGVLIGLSYSGLTLEFSARVHLWGPPFAGEAEIHWLFISCTVQFGEQRKPELPPYGWASFKRDFLPPENDSLTIAVVRGLLKEVKDQDLRIVNPYQLRLLAKSAVPSKSIKVNGEEPKLKNGNKANVNLGIRPMKLQESEFDSLLELEVYSRSNGKKTYQEMTTHEVVVQSVPVALWGGPKEKPDPDPKEKPLISDVQTGVQLAPPDPRLSGGPCPISPELEARDSVAPWALLSATTSFGYLTKDVRGVIKSNDNRRMLLQKLIEKKWVKDGAIPDPTTLGTTYAELEKHLQDTPVECGIGMLPGRTEFD